MSNFSSDDMDLSISNEEPIQTNSSFLKNNDKKNTDEKNENKQIQKIDPNSNTMARISIGDIDLTLPNAMANNPEFLKYLVAKKFETESKIAIINVQHKQETKLQEMKNEQEEKLEKIKNTQEENMEKLKHEHRIEESKQSGEQDLEKEKLLFEKTKELGSQKLKQMIQHSKIFKYGAVAVTGLGTTGAITWVAHGALTKFNIRSNKKLQSEIELENRKIRLEEKKADWAHQIELKRIKMENEAKLEALKLEEKKLENQTIYESAKNIVKGVATTIAGEWITSWFS